MPIGLIVYVNEINPEIKKDLSSIGKLQFELYSDKACILRIPATNSEEYEDTVSKLNAKGYVKKVSCLSGILWVPRE